MGSRFRNSFRRRRGPGHRLLTRPKRARPIGAEDVAKTQPLDLEGFWSPDLLLAELAIIEDSSSSLEQVRAAEAALSARNIVLQVKVMQDAAAQADATAGRLVCATWALVLATLGLILATAAVLIWH